MPAVGRPKGLPHTGGRVKGTPNHATAEIKELARVHAPAGVARLAKIAFEDAPGELQAVETLKAKIRDGATTAEIARFAREASSSRNDLTRVAAIKELFDRGYGKAPQPHDGDGEGGAIKHIVSWEE